MDETFVEDGELFISDLLIDSFETSGGDRGGITAIDQAVGNSAFEGLALFMDKLDCKVADYLRIRAALRKLSANGSTLFANGDSRSVMPVLNTRDRKWLDKTAL